MAIDLIVVDRTHLGLKYEKIHNFIFIATLLDFDQTDDIPRTAA
ncbi:MULTISPECIES: hypothetical protein [unclassified Microcoleus]